MPEAYWAAREGDALLHSNWLSDAVSLLTEALVYAAAAAAAVATTTTTTTTTTAVLAVATGQCAAAEIQHIDLSHLLPEPGPHPPASGDTLPSAPTASGGKGHWGTLTKHICPEAN